MRPKIFLLTLFAFAQLSLIATTSYAKTFTVDSTVDENDADLTDGECKSTNNHCTLRAAIQQSNELEGKDTVVVPAGTYVLSAPQQSPSGTGSLFGSLLISDPIDIKGAGKSQTRIDGNGVSHIFGIYSNDIKISDPLIRATGLNTFRYSISDLSIRNTKNASIDAKSYQISETFSYIGPYLLPVTINTYTIRTLDISLTNMGITAANGAGVSAMGSVKLQIRSCEITDNKSEGIDAETREKIIVDDTIVARNGGGIRVSSHVIASYDEYIGAEVKRVYLFPLYSSALSREYEVNALEITNSTITDNVATSFNGGGIGVSNFTSLYISNSTVTNNSAKVGGGLYLTSMYPAYIENSEITNNYAINTGGGIYTSAKTVINSARVSNNNAHDGAGIYATILPRLLNVDVKNNIAQANGGGIYFDTISNKSYGSLYYGSETTNDQIRNTRINSNQANQNSGSGGGIFVSSQDKYPMKFQNVSIIGNTAAAGLNIYHLSGYIEFLNSTISNPIESGPSSVVAHNIESIASFKLSNSILNSFSNFLNCDGLVVSGGGNISSDNSCALNQPTDKNGINPDLSTVDLNTNVQTPNLDSPAIDNAIAMLCPKYDQFNFSRTGNCDIGAVEYNGVTRSPGSFRWKTKTVSVAEGTEIEVAVERYNGSDGEVQLSFSPDYLRQDIYTSSIPPGERVKDIWNLEPLDDIESINPESRNYRLNWSDGDTTDKVIYIKAIDDKYRELEEKVNIVLLNPEGGATIDGIEAMMVSIPENNLRYGEFSFSNGYVSVSENDKYATIQVARAFGSDKAVSVNFETADDDAKAGIDYIATNGVLTWDDGDIKPKTISIPIIDDDLYRPYRVFKVRLLSPTGGAVIASAKSGKSISIIDNDPIPISLSFDFNKSEFSFNESSTMKAIGIARDRTDNALTLKFKATSGSAEFGNDFLNDTGTISFRAGDKYASIPIRIIDDKDVEQTESFTITITSETKEYKVISGDTIKINIIDDDSAQSDAVDISNNQPPIQTGTNDNNSSTSEAQQSDDAAASTTQPSSTQTVISEPTKKHWYSSADGLLTLVLLSVFFTRRREPRGVR